jgi:uncharacterized spore protein YtfJ
MSNHNHYKSSIIEHLANHIEQTLKAKIIFSDPVQRNGITVIPTAKIIYGIGFGSGTYVNKKGKGGGVGIYAKPIGYIEIKDNKTSFVPISNTISYPSLLLASGIGIYLLLKLINKIT